MNLTTFEIIRSFIVKLNSENINFFSKKELEEQLKVFANNKKYSSLFEKDLDITTPINSYIMCGYLTAFETDKDTIYIIKSDKKINYNTLLNEALESYCNFRKLCDNYENLSFNITNSDGTYMLIKGKIENKNIEWTLYTDGIITKRNISLIKGTKNSFNNPFTNQKEIFDKAEFKIIDIYNSTYVLRQEMINNKINHSIIYTDTIENNIDEIAKIYCKK